MPTCEGDPIGTWRWHDTNDTFDDDKTSQVWLLEKEGSNGVADEIKTSAERERYEENQTEML